VPRGALRPLGGWSSDESRAGTCRAQRLEAARAGVAGPSRENDSDRHRLARPWKGKLDAAKIPVEPSQTAARTAHVARKSPTRPRLDLGWHTPGASDLTATAAQTVLNGYCASGDADVEIVPVAQMFD
jgi:hypothetical protein